MKSGKIISFILMLTMLFTANSTALFALPAPASTTLTLDYNSEGGSVTASPDQSTFYKDEKVCTTDEHEHGDGTSCDFSNLVCNKHHEHSSTCNQQICGKEEHVIHGAGCYSNGLTCNLPIHDHKHDCWGLTCTKEEHIHFYTCNEVVCGKEEHEHSEQCKKLVCNKDHNHNKYCYNNVCGKEKHSHSIICYGNNLICGKEGHLHIDHSCYGYVCGCIEHKKHHDKNCYGDILTCNLFHQHSDACYTIGCGIPEHLEHTTAAGCYTCSKTPHTHGDSCYDWPSASVTATANVGYYIRSLSGTGNTETLQDKATSYTTSTFKMDTDRTVSVVFTKLQCKVNGVPADSSMGSVIGSATVDYGSDATLTAVPKTGFRFVQWNDGDTSNPRTFTNITSDISHTATFVALKQHAVTTGKMGTGTGEVSVSPSGPYYEGDDVTITATPDTGSTFDGWDGLTDKSNPYIVSNLNSDISLTAIFTKNQYTVTGTSDDESMGSVTGSGTVDYGSDATLAAVPKTGFRFVQWDDGNTSNPRTFTNIQSDINRTATFVALSQYAIITNTTGSGVGIVSVSPASPYYQGDNVTISAIADPGSHFVKWLEQPGASNPYIVTSLKTDITLTALFAKLQYNVNGVPADSSMGSVAGSATVDYGTETTLTAVPNTGFRFVQWDDGNTSNPRTFTNIQSNINRTAIFEAIPQYRITTNTTGSGVGIVSVSPEGPYYQGINVTISAIAHPGSHFVKWIEQPEAPNPYIVNNLNQNITLTAKFDLNPDRYLEAAFNKDDSTPGSENAWIVTNPSTMDIEYEWFLNDIKGGTGTVPSGQSITLKTTVDKNPDILKIQWEDSYNDISASYATAKMFTYIEVDAKNGSIERRTLNEVVSGPAIRTYYFEGTTVTLTAVANSGYRFVNGSWDINPKEDIRVTTSGAIATIYIEDSVRPTLARTAASVFLSSEEGQPAWINGIHVKAGFELIPVTPTDPPSTPSNTYYSLNIAVEGSGSVLPLSGSFMSGNMVTMTPKADEGARFVGWFGANGAEVNSSNGILMTGNKSVIARFEAISPEVVVDDEEVPLGGDTTIPQGGDTTTPQGDGADEEVLLDEAVPKGDAELPKTGGLPLELMFGAGFALTSGGLFLRRKQEKK